MQSAVSQNCILRGIRQFGGAGEKRRPADFKSAIRQIENLRYEEFSPAPGGFWGRNKGCLRRSSRQLSIVGNQWQEQASRVPDKGNWVSGWLDPRQANNTDKTNVLLLLQPKYGALGPYAGSKDVYRCIASKVMAKVGGVSQRLNSGPR